MDKAKIFLEDGSEKLVNCLFYLYNSKYYFLYTENEKDENGYVRLYLVKVGKETTNTSNGTIETGNMIGIEVPTDDEWKEVQGSISKIVNSKKTKIEDKDIQYLPIDMLVNLKVMSKKTFKLLANIIENDFNVKLDETNNDNDEASKNIYTIENVVEEPIVTLDSLTLSETINEETNQAVGASDIGEEEQKNIIAVEKSKEDDDYDNQDIIIDYRTRFFEEQEKNKRLNEEIEKLKEKLISIDQIIKGD